MVHHSNTADLKYALKVKLTCLELLMNISITATLRSEILETAKNLSTGHTTSQTNHSKFSVWINCEDVNPTKNKGRVYTHISAGNKWWRFSVTLGKGDLHTVLPPQTQQQRSQPYPLGLQLLPQCSCQPTPSSCSSILHSTCIGGPSDRRLQELLLLVWWPHLNHPDKVHNSSTEEETVFLYKGSSSAS